MQRKWLRRWSMALAASALLALLAGWAALAYLGSRSFENTARVRVVSALARATGARVALRSLRFDWRTATVQARGLELHGTEPSTAPPLLAIPELTIALDWRALLGRTFDAHDITAVRPQLRLLLYPDGSTNLPKLAPDSGSFLNKLFDLHVSRYEIRDGVFAVNQAARAFSLRGENLGASLRALPGARAYRFDVSTRELTLKARCCADWPVAVTARGVLRPNLLQFENVQLSSRETQVEAQGTLRDFARPVADFKYRGATAASAIRAAAGLDGLRGGDFAVNGSAHFEPSTGLRYQGHLTARQVAYASRQVHAAGISADSDFQYAHDLAELTSLRARLLGGEFAGSATVRSFGSFGLTGNATNIGLEDALAALGQKRLPWRARLNGRVEAGDRSGFDADLTLQPVSSGSALAGHVVLTTSAASDLHFADSHLALPQSRLVFHGSQKQGISFALDSRDLAELQPIWARLGLPYASSSFPVLLPGGSASLAGTWRGALSAPNIAGTLALARFRALNRVWDRLQWTGSAASNGLVASSYSLDTGNGHASGSGTLALDRWRASGASALQLQTTFRGLELTPFSGLLTPVSGGRAGGTLAVSGTVSQPAGQAHLRLADVVAYEETIPRVRADLSLAGDRLRIERGVLSDRKGDDLAFQGDYRHAPGDWRTGDYSGVINSERFEISHVDFTRKLLPWMALRAVKGDEISGTLAIHAQVAARVTSGGLVPLRAQGDLHARNVVLAGEPFGNIDTQLETQGESLQLKLAGDVRGNDFSGEASLALNRTQMLHGTLHFGRVPLPVWRDLLLGGRSGYPALAGFAAGSVSFEGPLNQGSAGQGSAGQGSAGQGSAWRAAAHVSELEASHQLRAASFVLRSAAPFDLELASGVLRVGNLDLRGRDTAVTVHGSLDTRQPHAVNLDANGAVNLQALALLDENMQASGNTILRASVRGTLANPLVTGALTVENGAVIPRDFSSGLSAINGTLALDGNRATIKTLTAQAGGGQLALTGFITLGGGAPLTYHLDARASNTRLRSASGISVTGDANLRLTGASASTLLSGSVTVARIVFTPTTDVGNLLAGFATPRPGGETSILPGVELPSIQLDVSIHSASNLQVNTALSPDIGADIDLQLRGTTGRPVLLGSVTADQGDIRVFGSRYTINRGDVSFLNPAGIDPVLDLDLQTEARGINVDITISGTIDRLNINYRSDPPLQPRDIIALLAVGRTPQESANVQSSQVASTDTSALQSGASSVLGQAISPSSNRLSKLFGVTNIKLDPLVQGITSTPESRLTLEQQISRAITVTYVTNLEQTSEQIFRLEYSISREYSLVAVRDDNGEFGIDLQYKRRFK